MMIASPGLPPAVIETVKLPVFRFALSGSTTVAAGAAKGTGEAATKFVVDGYASLKGLLKRKFGDDGSVAKAVQGLEENPASEGRKQVLKEEHEVR